MSISLAELRARGIELAAHEAIAVAQKLIAAEVIYAPHVPFGAPSESNLYLAPDGTVIYRGGEATPSVFEIGVLLQTLLPAGGSRTAGALRYAIARALLDVDAPPFDSVDELGRTLGRFERGEASEVLASVAARAGAIERRRTLPSTAALRRELREADRQLYELRIAAEPAPLWSVRVSASILPMPVEKPARNNRFKMARAPIAAGLAAGIALMAAGQFMHLGRPVLRGPAPATAGIAPAGDTEDHTAIGRESQAPSQSPVSSESEVPPQSAVSSQSPIPGRPPAQSQPAVAGPSALARQSQLHPAAAATPSDPGPQGIEQPSGSTLPANRAIVRPQAPRAGGDPAGSRSQLSSRFARQTDHDGALVRALDDRRQPVFSPAFASNGTGFFFHSGGSRDERSALLAAEESGGELRVMTIVDDGAKNYHVQPSPDGRMIAFDSDRDGERGVYVAHADGTGVRRVSGAGYAAVPTWSPDGERLAFVRAEPANARIWNLWLLRLASGDVERITSFRFGQTWSASWFREGNRIAFTHEDRLIIKDLSTGSTREFASPVARRLVRTPAVSPDGTKVIFQVYRSGAWMLDLPAGTMRRVLADPTAEEFAWSRDGRRVAFHSRRDGEWGIWMLGAL
jgi:hypothetical protein